MAGFFATQSLPAGQPTATEQAATFDMKCINQLELIVDPTADGTRADWGLWMELELVR